MGLVNSQHSGKPCRRAFLRSAGLTLALPWFESLPVRGEESGKRAPSEAAYQPPVRFACVFFSNGVEPAHWWAKGQGAEMQLGPGLQSLQPHTEELIFLRGLFNEQARNHKSAHLGRIPNLLSGGWVSTEQNDIRCGRTMDQVMADEIGRQTPVKSLVLGVEPTELRLEDGLSMLYGSSISWTSETKPTTKEIYPARVFDLLVGDVEGRRTDRSVLDHVLADAKALNNELTSTDRHKFGEFLESIRDIEMRLGRAQQDRRLEGWRPSLAEPNMKRPADTLPQDVPTHMKLMLDLIVLAFQMDKTRIATCMLNNDLSQMNFGFLDGVEGSLHLDLTHNGQDPKKEAMYLKTNQFHVQQFAYLLERLQGVEEGGRSMLDNSLLLCCSNLFDGDKHEADQMPMLLAGKGGGSLKTGRVLDFLESGDEHRRACSLYLSLMKKMGVRREQFGDARKPLAEI
ncbi:MAG: DUF1552 domain-containing protein [Pirellulaceae bacterium]|nr:DUF1552 domain-containing protein [Pirellulaceae bacterium]